jgi:probable rRNA maturation factor
MRLAIETVVECNEWNTLPNLDALIAECLDTVLRETGETLHDCAEVNFLFCDDDRMRELNRQFRGVDKPTNVLSFPGPEPTESAYFLGDIALAYPTILKESKEQSKSLECHSRHMIVHGFLHLLGFDHENPADAEVMEAAEIRILKGMGIENPYWDDNQSETDFDGRD